MFSSVMGACSFPFVLGAHARLDSAVVPVMGSLFQSWGWLAIVEAPGYSRHPSPNGHLSTMTTFFCPKVAFEERFNSTKGDR